MLKIEISELSKILILTNGLETAIRRKVIESEKDFGKQIKL
jgi:hypothetical protein